MLEINFDTFTWQRPAKGKGFTWEPAGNDKQLALAAGIKLEDHHPDRALFLNFAYLNTPEDCLKFANKYGALGKRLEHNPLSFWQRQIQILRQAVDLQDALEDLKWEEIRRKLDSIPGDWPFAREAKKKLAAGKALSQEELVHGAVARLLYPAQKSVTSLEPSPVWNAAKRTIELRLQHTDLLDFMVFQFGHALISKRKFQSCKVCGTWFQLDPKVARSDRTTCRDYCRLRLYRQRQAEAQELHAKGWALKRIVKKLESDTKTIKNWIAKGVAK
jgi:hypothetical protein